ncbi:hypothetical protein D3C76_786940 [compost metagenome]
MAEIHHRFHQFHILLEREMAAVNHRAAHASVDLTANILQRFMVIEVQRQRHVVADGVGATQGVDLFECDMFKGAGRPGEDHRGSHFAAHFEDRLDRLSVVDVKRRHGVPFCLRILQKIFG